MRTRLLFTAGLTVVLLGALTAIVVAKRSPGKARSLSATLVNADGARIGTVKMTAKTASSPVDVRVTVRRLQPGFHGLHVHAVGLCEGPTFMSATGHLKQADTNHGLHRGDMPSLLVKANGTATLRFTTDGFDIGELRDADGSAVMVHAGADNFGNVPERYAPNGPDQQTLDTGDSGARAACGPIAAAG